MVGYLKGEERVGSGGVLTDFRGKKVGTYRVTASWRTPNSRVSDRMLQVVATVGGTRYTGRSMGNNMAFHGKKMAGQRSKQVKR